jgi:hypothetical protein
MINSFNIILIIFSHFILDYPLQGDFLAQSKGKYFYSLLAHSIIYGLGMAICFNYLGYYELWKVFVLIVSHLVIDYFKANNKNKDKALTTYLYIDQALHLLINFALVFL